MVRIDYPSPSFKTKDSPAGRLIFDELRKTWLKLTPEEWVRQNFVQYLLQKKNYPSTLIALEKQLQLGELSKRFDILVYDRSFKPWMMVECKSMDVKLDAKVLEQLLRYNISIPVPFLVITNGKACYAFDRSAGRLEELSLLPDHV